jgi:hypothetical protein
MSENVELTKTRKTLVCCGIVKAYLISIVKFRCFLLILIHLPRNLRETETGPKRRLLLSLVSLKATFRDKFTHMIRHTVVFKLIHSRNSPEEKVFLDAIGRLSAIPGVENFELLRQVSRKNNFDYGLSMEFATAQAYEDYNQHPDHVAFVRKVWKTEVSDFLEIDYEPLT